jgi:phage anti-repressor protein
MTNQQITGLTFNIMNIELINKFIDKADFARVKTDKPKVKKTREVKISLKNETFVNTKNPKAIKVRNYITIEIEQTAKLDIIYDFEFRLDIDFSKEIAITEEFKSTTMSMAYPYMKTFAEQMFTMSGISGAELPFLDFNEIPSKNIE